MCANNVCAVELTALRLTELEPLVNDLDRLLLASFSYVSFHAPSSFSPEEEGYVLNHLQRVASRGWNIVAHPDVIYTPQSWAQFGTQLLLENMDRRKTTGRTATELKTLFAQLPEARMCLDLAHARQLDTTLTLLGSLIHHFRDRIAEVHISELDSRCQHRPLSASAVSDYQRVTESLIGLPVIIESVLAGLDPNLRKQELHLAQEAMRDNFNEVTVRGRPDVRILPRRKAVS